MRSACWSISALSLCWYRAARQDWRGASPDKAGAFRRQQHSPMARLAGLSLPVPFSLHCSIDLRAWRSPLAPPLCGGRGSIEAGQKHRTLADPVLIAALRKAHAMGRRDASGLPLIAVAPMASAPTLPCLSSARPGYTRSARTRRAAGGSPAHRLAVAAHDRAPAASSSAGSGFPGRARSRPQPGRP